MYQATSRSELMLTCEELLEHCGKAIKDYLKYFHWVDIKIYV